MNKSILFLLISVSFYTLFSCQRKQTEEGIPQLTVSIIPQKYLVSYIAGAKMEVQEMLPPGSNHETYEPAPRDMEKISSSKLYFAIGALDFELTWLDRLQSSNPSMKVIQTSTGIEMISGHKHGSETGAEPMHNTGGKDPHTWLSPSCMRIHASNICKALSDLDTTNASFYADNMKKFNLLADSTDQIIHEKLKGCEGKSILIYHPALAYFARDYNIEQISIEQDGKEPSPAYLAELIKIAGKKNIRSIFISKEFDTRNAEAIAAEIHGKVIVFDPMSEKWAENLIHLAELIATN